MTLINHTTYRIEREFSQAWLPWTDMQNHTLAEALALIHTMRTRHPDHVYRMIERTVRETVIA